MTLVHSGQEAVIPAVESSASNVTVWVVLGSSGQWSDWTQWVVEVHGDEQAAKDRVGSLTAAYRQLMSEAPELTYDDEGGVTPEYQQWLDRFASLDALADQYDEPRYTAGAVPFINALSIPPLGISAPSAEMNQAPPHNEQVEP